MIEQLGQYGEMKPVPGVSGPQSASRPHRLSSYVFVDALQRACVIVPIPRIRRLRLKDDDDAIH